MKPTSDCNLRGFLSAYGAHRRYFLAYASFRHGGAETVLTLENHIRKCELNVREAWEVGSHDVDSIGIRDDDDPVIPAGKADAPVLELLRWKREQ
jgi:hypothetical protein